jgi:hypothetical protein
MPGAFGLQGRHHPATALQRGARSVPTSNWTLRRRLVAAWFRDRHQFVGGRLPRLCPICNHDGIMISVGHPARWDARCARCGSRERHRLLWLWTTESLKIIQSCAENWLSCGACAARIDPSGC